MIAKRSMVYAAVLAALGVTLTAGTIARVSLRMPDETAPPGGMVQMKVWTTEVTPIFGGRPSITYSASTFSRFAGFSIAAPNGEAAGAAVIDGNHAQIFYSGTSMFTAHYPILTVSLAIRSDAIPGSTTQFTLDPASTFSFSTIGSVAAKISPATVTVGGSTSITDVIPGEGVWPAGTVVTVRGTGFDAKTSLRVNGAPVSKSSFVSSTELRFQLLATSDVRGLRIVARGANNSVTYYSYMRGIRSIVSARTLLAATEPIFSVNPRTVATFGPSGRLSGDQYMALALQNPNMAAVTVHVSLYAANGKRVHRAKRTLESRHRLALTLSELLDGITPAGDMRVVVSASAPIDAFSLLCDEGTSTVSPILPLESTP
jgi:hypothetical protein